MTRDNRKNPEYHVVAAIRKLMQTDTNCPAGKSWPNHVKNEQHIGSKKTYGPKKSFTDPAFIGSIFVCGPLHHHVLLFSFLGAVGLFRSDMLLIFYMV